MTMDILIKTHRPLGRCRPSLAAISSRCTGQFGPDKPTTCGLLLLFTLVNPVSWLLSPASFVCEDTTQSVGYDVHKDQRMAVGP